MEVEIKAAGWRYRRKSTGKFASPVERGAKVELDDVMEEDIERARAHGVFIEASTSTDDGPSDTSGAPFDQGIGALSEWLREAKLNIPDTVKLAGGDATKARMLIDAEPAATSGKPRAGVLKALGQLIVRAEESGDATAEPETTDGDTTDENDADGDEGTAPEADDEQEADAAGDGDDDEDGED